MPRWLLITIGVLVVVALLIFIGILPHYHLSH